MSRTKTKRHGMKSLAGSNGIVTEVFTLAEVAAYLRVAEEEVLRMVHEQRLPARQVGTEWRFLKSAVQEWLGQPILKRKPGGIWSAVGSWKDDPYLDELLKEIYRKRGRAMSEDG